MASWYADCTKQLYRSDLARTSTWVGVWKVVTELAEEGSWIIDSLEEVVDVCVEDKLGDRSLTPADKLVCLPF